MPQELFPGDEVKVTEGRYKGKVGLILSTEQSRRRGIIYEVKLPFGSHKSYRRSSYDGPICSEDVYEREYTIITKLAINSLELVGKPKEKEDEYLGRRLLLIQEDKKK